ncbi:unnamed protein product [Adineta steineri]|uniref:Uncharacterized protein n=1 Tax=Adineta steineri TaxID=433720 RepID=A0A818GZQ2_9BILA|nr:unnamed protein product [Adineta steineri]CAF3497828.1 unnamed protein product [Adineta steineri]
MTNIDNEQKSNKNTTKVVIITSVDDDNDNILSCLNPSNIETFVVDLNHTDLVNVYENHNKNKKRTLSQTEHDSLIDMNKNMNMKKRKADLTCVVCGGQAIGYNFAQITCESCKAFFRRNALHPIEKTKCTQNQTNFNKIHCDVQFNVKRKCQRCRLLKCFQQGMRKDFILTAEEKKYKQERLEENRRLRTTFSNDDNNIDSKEEIKPTIIHQKSEPIVNNSSYPSLLSESDLACLLHIQSAYLSASQSTPHASSVISLELAPDKISAFMSTFDIQNLAAVKLINFIREIPEFEQLDEHDRLILVKYNLTLLFLIRHSLTFDSVRELCYDLDTTDTISPTDEAFALQCKSLFILCYGYEFNQAVIAILHVLVNIVNKDPIIVQLLMLIMIFSKGLSADNEREPILNDEQRVYHAQAKYTDLLFRYLLQKSSYENVTTKMTRITEQLLKIQKLLRDFHQYIKSKVDLNHINPLMRSLFQLT